MVARLPTNAAVIDTPPARSMTLAPMIWNTGSPIVIDPKRVFAGKSATATCLAAPDGNTRLSSGEGANPPTQFAGVVQKASLPGAAPLQVRVDEMAVNVTSVAL